ncbi:MAG: carotenoid 1,2-hydratase [Rubrivivax sp.]
MTERGRRHVRRDRHSFDVGPSQVLWRDGRLELHIDERGPLLGRRVRGVVRVIPQGLSTFDATLDLEGRHRWGPIAPCARVELALDQPAQRWSGSGYLDTNEGDEPIERGFRRWDWLRTASAADGGTTVLYDLVQADGRTRLIARRFAADGSSAALPVDAPRQPLPPTTWWRVDRQLRTVEPRARVRRTLEDTPFYARSLVELPQRGGTRVDAVHETLDIARLTHPVVQAMLPVRMPRRT